MTTPRFDSTVGRTDRPPDHLLDPTAPRASSEVIVLFVKRVGLRSNTIRAADNLTVMAFGFAAFLFVLLGEVLRRIVPLGSIEPLVWVALIASTLVVLAVWVYRNVWNARGRSKLLEASDLPDGMQSANRVKCVGLPTHFSDEGEFADRSFEPRVFVLPFASVTLRANGLRTGLAMATVTAGAALLTYLLFGEIYPSRTGIFQLWAAIFGGYLAISFLWPTYLRVAPRRADLVRFSVFRRKPILLEAHNLATARVVVNTVEKWVLAEDGARKLELSMRLVPGARRLMYFVLLAAISSHEPGPLPDDELLG